MPNPYASHVGDRDALAVLRSSLDDYGTLTTRLAPGHWTRPWAPGKWTAAQVMVHVTQWEMVLGVRLRCGLAVPDYVVQAVDQDDLMRAEGLAVDGPTALATFQAIRRMNIALASALSPEQRRTPIRHPERGQIDVEDVLVTLAGHGVHHLKQLQGMTAS
jgi:hypothetical protein